MQWMGAVVLLGTLGLASLAQSSSAAAVSPTPLDYRDTAHWICRSAPGAACGDDLSTTILLRDGTTQRQAFRPATDPKADCFYVYPTVSLSKGLTSQPEVTEAERRAVKQQAERFTSVCRLFAPIYRQVTIAAMMPGFPKPTAAEDHAASTLAVGDVFAAWDDYMAHDNHGRPVILIGHSQGAFMVIKLLQERIDGHSFAGQLVSAIVPGAFVTVPKGKTVGGTFKSIPPCRAANQVGCIIAFNSVRAESQLPPEMKAPSGDEEMVCTNPASLAGGPGVLKPYLSTAGETIIPALTAPQPPWTKDGAAIETPFVTTPGLYVAECRADEHGALLAVSHLRLAGDHRTAALTGDWVVQGKVELTMGLHLIDLNLTGGNLIEVLRRQVAAISNR